MVTYEYKCRNPECGLVKQIPASGTIPFCHNNPMKRVYSISGVSFKGSGFYKTDNRD